jgi:hypothetical protein
MALEVSLVDADGTAIDRLARSGDGTVSREAGR